MKQEVYTDKIFCTDILYHVFGDTVSENNVFALDIHYELKSESFIPINEKWA